MKRFKNLLDVCMIILLVIAVARFGIWWRATHPDLQYIVKHGTVAQLKRALKNARNINSEDGYFICKKDVESNGYYSKVYDLSPLYEAAEHGKLEMAKVLLQAKADPNAGDEMITPMAVAIQEEQPDILLLMIKAGGDVNAKGSPEDRPVTIAALYNNRELFDLILTKRPNLIHEKTGTYDSTPFQLASACPDPSTSFLKHLIDLGSNVIERDSVGMQAIHYAANRGTPTTLKYLIEHGADPYSYDEGGHTILHSAAEGENLACVKYIATRYPKLICRPDNEDETPLSKARETNSTNLIAYLVSVGGNREPKEQVARREQKHKETIEMLDHTLKKLSGG